ncbi:hypothetical protein Tco_1341604, partial [Tanacetum coccineum]
MEYQSYSPPTTTLNTILLYHCSITQNGQTRPKKHSELTEAQQLQDDCDVQETNIILHGFPPDVYALVNNQEAAKDIWHRVKMLMKGTELSYQERECRYLVVPTFQQGEDPIEFINKAMTFMYSVASRFPPSNNQLRTSSNPRNQETIQDGSSWDVSWKKTRRNEAYTKKRLKLNASRHLFT